MRYPVPHPISSIWVAFCGSGFVNNISAAWVWICAWVSYVLAAFEKAFVRVMGSYLEREKGLEPSTFSLEG